ncbi:MAG: GIY-YIG nuclease family protein [Thermoplasmata archaeon]|nr:GIY-YIG nuclease family protein [Thermoplasmata archaeon]
MYVGSAQGGVRQRVGRHLSKRKRTHWHIDHLLKHGEVLSTMVIPCDSKDGECAVAEAVSRADGSTVPIPGFGSSDCSCESHLFYFGDVDARWATESLAHAVAFLPCAYERERETG